MRIGIRHRSRKAPRRPAGGETRSALSAFHGVLTSFHMKTTLTIDDAVMKALKREAAARGRTMSELVETALRMLLRGKRRSADLPELPVFDGGSARVDIANREALYDFMGSR